MTIKEIIVVEGRDDESAVKAALPDAEIIVTHGYGIGDGTWKPVSYTHLDVYKRQGRALPGWERPAPPSEMGGLQGILRSA